MSPATHTTRTASSLGLAYLELLPVTGVAISVFDRADWHSTIYASDDTATLVDEAQFDLGEGPLFQSFHDAQPVLLDDLSGASTERWPVFREALRQTDARALFSFPLMLGAVCVGVASLYRTSTGPLNTRAIAAGETLSRSIAGPALRHAVDAARRDVAPSSIGIELRRDVHQATGMVLAQLGVTATEAFARLRAHAFATDRTVHEVAHDVIGKTVDFRRLPE